MKIAFVNDVVYPFREGGSPKRTYEIAKHLAKRGHEVHYFGFNWWGPQKNIERDEIFFHGVGNPIPLFNNNRRSIREAFFFSSSVFPNLIKQKFDIIDCVEPPYLHCYPIKAYCLHNKTPLVLTNYEMWQTYWRQYAGLIGVVGELIERNVKSLPDVIVTISNYMKRRLIELGIKDEKVYVIPIGVNYEATQSIVPSTQCFDVVFLGRLVRQKRVDILLRAIQIIIKTIPKLKVGIIGDGPMKKDLEQFAVQTGISTNVVFLGKIESQEKVMGILKSAKVFVYPTAPEGGTSLSILEANACGLPVITIKYGEIGSSEDVVIDNYNGLSIEKSYPTLMADTIELLLNDAELRNEMLCCINIF